MSYILHIDTSGKTGKLFLAKDATIIAHRTNSNERDHAATINVYIREILKEAAIKTSDLDAVAAIGGPGSYTGLRIGLATAKGLCYALNIPLFLHNKLDQMAMQAWKRYAKTYEGYIALLPAREGEYFITAYDKEGMNIFPARHIDEKELNPYINANKNFLIVDERLGDIDEKMWAELTLKDFNSGHTADLAHTVPFYLKEVYTTTTPKHI